MSGKRKDLEQFLNRNRGNIPFGSLIRKIEVSGGDDGQYIIQIISIPEEITFDKISISSSEGSVSSKKRKLEILREISKQEEKVIEPYKEIIREKTKDSAKKWKKEHPLKKRDFAFLNSKDVRENFPESTRQAIIAVSSRNLAYGSMKFSFGKKSIRAEIPGFPYAAEYVPETGEYRSPFSAMNIWYKNMDAIRTGVDTLNGVREYVAEKGYPAYVSYDKKNGTICLSFSFDGYTSFKNIIPAKAYKNAVRKAYNEAKKEYRKWKSDRKRTIIENPYFGTVIADAIFHTVEENPKRRTPNQISDILRGVRLKDDYVLGEDAGKFNIFSDDDIKAAITSLCEAGMLSAVNISGKYQDYKVIEMTPEGVLFKNLQEEGGAQKPKTELDYLKYIESFLSGETDIPENMRGPVAGILVASPGIFCKSPEEVMLFSEMLPRSAIKQIENGYGEITSRASAAVARYMIAAARGKRKRLPPNGVDLMKEKKEKERLAELEREKRELEILDQVLTEIPQNYVDLYPLARMMKRRFILHLGPTNSGKTYMAINDLMEATRGIYLAPLRLLAFEQYEKMNQNGCPCSLVTGEEQVIVEGAMHQSSTIEMLNIRDVYDVAVIDEAQMIADDNRGGAWAAAIMGVRAEVIHVCAALEAENILKKIITDCGDEYTVIKHQRMTPLVYEKKRVKFPENVHKGDALIVFSRKSVHAVASILQKRRVKCSIIYGALPYDVRHRQAEKFQSGETDVVVATDAIGMGMNLPIKRVVLMEMSKFDGKQKRPLLNEEIRQITGRAGRYGVYDIGYAASESGDRSIAGALTEMPAQLTEAVIGFPEILIGIDATMVEIIRKWVQIVPGSGWKKESVEQMLRLAVATEELHAPKKLEYDFLTIPFDDENEDLLAIWYDFFKKETDREEYDIYQIVEQIDIEESSGNGALATLERQHAALDLYFNIARKFQPSERTFELIMEKKRVCSERIMKILEKQKLRGKTCRCCGRELPWNYPFGICERCYKSRRYYE